MEKQNFDGEQKKRKEKRRLRRLRIMERISKKSGTTPGSLLYTGEKSPHDTIITNIQYSKDFLEESTAINIQDIDKMIEKPLNNWINFDYLHNTEIFNKLSELKIDIHPLVLEDILNIDQRPKVEDKEDYLFIVLKVFVYDDKYDDILVEQISMILGKNFLLTFKEASTDIFNQIKKRLSIEKTRLRQNNVDFLAYSLLDTIIDQNFQVLEKISDRIEFLEEEIIDNPTPETLQEIYGLKRKLAILRKSIWPMRDMISRLEKIESELIGSYLKLYFRDAYDHIIQIMDTVETLRDINSGLLDVYLSSISNRMNEVSIVLTIIATIFIPLSLLAGIYGMNFKYMPELEWQYGYFALILIMAIITAIIILYFKQKGWIMKKQRK